MGLPKIIQGGMGIGVSGWRLASAVAATGQLGVISGIALDEIFVRRLQLGDPGGHVRRALQHFPAKDIAKNIVAKFFKESRDPLEPFVMIEKQGPDMMEEREDLLVAAGFTEVFLSKEGHGGLVGVNLLEKTQTDSLSTLYGCMLAGVDYVTVGAGIPREVPGLLDKLSENSKTSFKLNVTNAIDTDDFRMTFDPSRFKQDAPLKRPKFLAIISSHVLASTLAKKTTGKIDGFIIENHTAAGHNAPSRTSKDLSPKGEPIYGERDEANIEKMREIGLPFWLAGGYAKKGKLKEAMALGAVGIQVGTPFMMAEESGIIARWRNAIDVSGKEVFTDPKASPTGFPFKVIQVPGSLSDKEIFKNRPRFCNLGYLRERYRKDDGTLGNRCPAEPLKSYLAKGGKEEDAVNCICLCNALFANIGLGSIYKNGYEEPPLLTAGESLCELDYVRPGMPAREIVEYLLED